MIRFTSVKRFLWSSDSGRNVSSLVLDLSTSGNHRERQGKHDQLTPTNSYLK